MELTSLNIFLLQKIITFHTFCIVFCFLSATAFILMPLFSSSLQEFLEEEESKTEEKNKKELPDSVKFSLRCIKFFGITCLVTLFLAVVLPSRQEAIEMIVIPKIANNELLTKMPSYVQEWIEGEIKKTTKEK